MKRFLTIFFVTLGVIFFCLIVAGAWFYITDPLNLKPLFFGGADTTMTVQPTDAAPPQPESDNATVDANPILNESQEAALETFGVDPAAVPSEITPEQEACFVEVLGQERVDEIVAGDSPTAIEFFTARDCI